MMTNNEILVPGRLYSVKEIASKLGVSDKMVYSLIARKILPAVRIGRLVKIDPDQYEKWYKALLQRGN
jgi:excisionase family DNA binding protein